MLQKMAIKNKTTASNNIVRVQNRIMGLIHWILVWISNMAMLIDKLASFSRSQCTTWCQRELFQRLLVSSRNNAPKTGTIWALRLVLLEILVNDTGLNQVHE